MLVTLTGQKVKSISHAFQLRQNAKRLALVHVCPLESKLKLTKPNFYIQYYFTASKSKCKKPTFKVLSHIPVDSSLGFFLDF